LDRSRYGEINDHRLHALGADFRYLGFDDLTEPF
jgi:hypothetical protein